MYGLELNELRLSFEPEPRIVEILEEISLRHFHDANLIVSATIKEVEESKRKATKEKMKNEGYIWESFFYLFKKIISYWQSVENKKYYNSWVSLQDALSVVRDIKKFYTCHCITISFFEDQLLSLEKLYPYTLFSSMGFITAGHECSICHEDMDSDNCIHLKGELYAGEIAYAIVKKIEKLDHVSLVSSPLDKRLVVGINDEHRSFKAFDDIISLFEKGEMNPINFGEAKAFEFTKENPNWNRHPRNEKCYCGSGIKFKKCCINHRYDKHRHVDFRRVKLIDTGKT